MKVNDILSVALPFAGALLNIIDTASKFDRGELDEDEVRRRIDSVKWWVEDSEKKDRDLFAKASAANHG